MGENESLCTYFNGGKNCPTCPGKCPKSHHRRWVEKDYQEKYEEQEEGIDVHKRDLLTEAQGKKTFAEQLLDTKVQESEALAKELLVSMQSVKENQKRLEEIALKPKVFTDMEYFAQMIKQEEEEKQPGWEQRKLRLETMRDEVLAIEQYSKVDNLNELFPQYQREIAEATKKRPKSQRAPGQSRADCVIS